MSIDRLCARLATYAIWRRRHPDSDAPRSP
jgi:hypothetical protein